MNGAGMPTDAPLDSTDPWDDIARELTTDSDQPEEAGAEQAPVEEAPVEEAPVEEAPVEEAPVEETPAEEPSSAENESEAGSVAPEEAKPQVTEGAADWNFLASELGIESGGPPPLTQENPADELFVDFTPTVLEDDEPVPFTDEGSDVEAEKELADDSDPSSSPEESPRPRRQRGRRRGSRGRGRRTESENESSGDDPDRATSEHEADGESEETEKPTRRRRSRRRGKRGGTDRQEEEREVDVAEVDSENEDSEEEEGLAKPTHRKIPTWGEAISVVVEANIEGRSKDSGRKGGRGAKKKGRR